MSSVRTSKCNTFAFCLALLLGASAFYAWLRNNQEPVYDGRPLREWLEYFTYPNEAFAHDVGSDEAKKHIGTKDIPALLRMVEASDSSFEFKLRALATHQHILKIDYTPAQKLNTLGEFGFIALGTQASKAVPKLTAIYAKQLSPSSQCAAAASLANIGPAAKSALPVLLRGLGNTNTDVTATTITTLGKIRAEPKIIVPLLIQRLSDTNQDIRMAVCVALGNMHSEPELSVPALAGRLGKDMPVVCWTALTAIEKFGPEAKPAVPALLDVLKHHQTSFWVKAYDIIKVADPQSEPLAHKELFESHETP